MLARIESSFAVREASEERMRQFVADASHELRTPLATVRGYAELYRQGAVPDSAAVGSAMERIEAESTRMSGLVEDLLTLARIDDAPVVETTQVDLTVLAADAVADARVRAPERRISLLGLDGPVAPTVVRGTESRLRQVVTNLVANALRHTPDGTPVEVAVGHDAGGVALEVRDHGPGRARRGRDQGVRAVLPRRPRARPHRRRRQRPRAGDRRGHRGAAPRPGGRGPDPRRRRDLRGPPSTGDSQPLIRGLCTSAGIDWRQVPPRPKESTPMSEQHPTPQWFTPSGGTTTAPRYEGAGAPTTEMPVHGYGATPPPMGPLGPLGQPAPQAPAPKPAKRGAGQLTAVAVLAALLASGGTAAAAHYWADDTPGRRHHLLGHPARQQRRGPGQAGQRVRT